VTKNNPKNYFQNRKGKMGDTRITMTDKLAHKSRRNLLEFRKE
jgi:hypothetical protein